MRFAMCVLPGAAEGIWHVLTTLACWFFNTVRRTNQSLTSDAMLAWQHVPCCAGFCDQLQHLEACGSIEAYTPLPTQVRHSFGRE